MPGKGDMPLSRRKRLLVMALMCLSVLAPAGFVAVIQGWPLRTIDVVMILLEGALFIGPMLVMLVMIDLLSSQRSADEG
jgi:hypothetical protein